MSDRPTTSLCTSSADDIVIRGRSLPRELIGQASFSEMLYFLVVGAMPTPGQAAVVDASLVALMEHGLTPSAVSARMTYTSAPEAMQGAVAAGLLSVGSLFVGTVEGCAALLDRIASSDDSDVAARIVEEHRASGVRIPGFGHPVHRPLDPRVTALREVARGQGLHGAHWEALTALESAITASRGGRPLPPNATGAVAAALSDCGVPAAILRGFAIVSRAAGLVAHIREEQRDPAMHALWHAAEHAVPYVPPSEEDR